MKLGLPIGEGGEIGATDRGGWGAAMWMGIVMTLQNSGCRCGATDRVPVGMNGDLTGS